MMHNEYFGKKILLATKHGKEVVIEKLIKQNLGADLIVPQDFDTDLYGTFSGEKKRIGGPIACLRKKCLDAMSKYQFDIGIASEGSFGPHPMLPFCIADDELVIFIDLKKGIEIIGRHISTKTNAGSDIIQNFEQIEIFANKHLFPSHGVILKKGKKMIKGIQSWDELSRNYQLIKKPNITELLFGKGNISIESDMRAHMNPSRMVVIELATLDLIKKLGSYCPVCSCPGWDITGSEKGLICEMCGSETNSIRNHIYSCQKCKHKEIIPREDGKKFEEPQFCLHCNP